MVLMGGLPCKVNSKEILLYNTVDGSVVRQVTLIFFLFLLDRSRVDD